MSNSTYIEMEDDVREDIGECLPSAPKKAEKRRVEDVQPEPQEVRPRQGVPCARYLQGSDERLTRERLTMTQQEYIAAIKKQQSLIRKLFSSRRRRSEIIEEVTRERYQHLVGKFFRPKGDHFKGAGDDMDYYIYGINTSSNYVMSDRVSIMVECRYVGCMYCDKQIDGIHTGYQTFSFSPDDDLDEILAPMLVDKAKAINTIDGYYAEMKKNFLK